MADLPYLISLIFGFAAGLMLGAYLAFGTPVSVLMSGGFGIISLAAFAWSMRND